MDVRHTSGAGSLVRLALCGVAVLAALPVDLPAEEHAADAFDWGFRLRLRQEYLANLYDFSEETADDNNYIRVRSQLWGSWSPNAQWKLYAMLNNEHRRWFKSNKGLEDEPFEIHELIVENLYIEGKRLGGTPFGFTVGRQNVMYGDGFVCWDGGPLDGSRTAYFNAILVNAVFDKKRLEAHFISNPKRDDYLPVANDQNVRLVEWKETGAGLYFADEAFGEGRLEAYYFFKNRSEGDASHPNGDIHMFGARTSGKWGDRITYMDEAAVQAGDRGGRSRLAFAFQLAGTYALGIETIPLSLTAGGLYLSGDDPASADRYEGWDPLYSRWPKWSDGYIYSLANERGTAYWENLSSLWLGFEAKLLDRLSFEEKLYGMWGPRPAPGGDLFTGSPGLRGTLSYARLSSAVNDHLKAYLLWEAFFPGDYYVDGSDTAHFLRWELMFTF